MKTKLQVLEDFSSNHPDAFELAMCLSLTSKIEPQLLRKARLHLLEPNTDPGSEADLWFSDLIQSRSPSGIVLREDLAQDLRTRLAEYPTLMEHAWRIVEELHKSSPIAVQIEEKMTWLALSNRVQELQHLLRQGVTTLLMPGRSDLAYWIVRALPRLPKALLQVEEAQMLIVGAYLRLGTTSLINEVPKEKVEEWRGWLAPADEKLLAVGVRLLEGPVIEFTRPMTTGSHRIEIPGNSPPVLEVVWVNQDGPQRHFVRIPEGKTALLAIESLQAEIHTLAGRSYILKGPPQVRPPRVQITYEADVGGAIQMKELPFVVGVMADLAGKPAQSLYTLEDPKRKFVEIDRDNFNDVMRGIGPRLAYTVDNKLTNDNSKIDVEIRFNSIDDFRPEQVIKQIEPLRKLIEVRKHLTALLAKTDGNDKLAEKLQEIIENTELQQKIGKEAELRTEGGSHKGGG